LQVDTSAISSQATTSTTTGKSSLALNTQDFMDLMITELTNQDPFEPMNNQELLNQMATIQQIQSSQQLESSFNQLMENYDSLLLRQELSTASGMIGEFVSGTTTSGSYVMGKVVAVNMQDENILLELDTGQYLNIKDVNRFGGSNSKDIIGQMVIGNTTAGTRVVGEVVSVEVDGTEATLHLHIPGTAEDETVAVPISSASAINQDTADLLIGYNAEGLNDIKGVINSVQWTEEGVLLNVINSEGETEKLPLTELTRIY